MIGADSWVSVMSGVVGGIEAVVEHCIGKKQVELRIFDEFELQDGDACSLEDGDV